MSENWNQIPVIWAAQGDEIVAVTATDRPLPGWTTIFGPELGKTLADLSRSSSEARERVQVRTFAMRDTDLPVWDSAVRRGSDGYSYGQVWGTDSKILKHVQIKEVGSQQALRSAPPIDPATLVMAAALHHIQQTLARMEQQLDSIKDVVQWLENRRESRQAAELLTAVDTLASVGRRCLASGVIHPEDLLRVAHLEQIAGTVHREILMELAAYEPILAFTQVKEAKQMLNVQASRIADLVRLDRFALDGLATYQRLLLMSKANGHRLSVAEVTEAKADLTRLAEATATAAEKLRVIDSVMKDRSIWDYLFTVGIPAGRSADRKLRERATAERKNAQAAASTARPAIDTFIKSLHTLDQLAIKGSKPPLMLVASHDAA